MLISKSLPWEVEHVHMDPQVKYVLVVLNLWSQLYVVVSVCVPPPFSSTILYTIIEKIAPYCPAKLLLMVDRPNPPSTSPRS